MSGQESTESDQSLRASRCANDHLSYPSHTRCPECGEPQTESVSLTDREATVLTWTTVTASPSGVRAPNTLAIVEFDIDGQTVRAIGSTTDAVETGQTVRPVYVEQLRSPEESVRRSGSQRWDGYRFEPVDE